MSYSNQLSRREKPICLPAAIERRLIHVEHRHREAIASFDGILAGARTLSQSMKAEKENI